MFPTRWTILVSPGKFLQGKAWSKPGIVGAIFFIFLAVWFGIHFWGSHFLAAAQESCAHFRYEKARQQIHRCLAVWPGNYQANFLAARICRACSDYPQAEKHLAVCVKLQGKSEDVELEWILLRAQKGEFLDLERTLWKWSAEGHARANLIQETLVFCYMKDGRYVMARQALDKWLGENPNAWGYFMRGFAAQKLGERTSAAADYQRALQLDPNYWQARVLLVQLLFAEKDYDQGRAHLSILQQTHADSPDVLLFTGMDHFQKGDVDQAEKCYDLALQAMPTNALALTERGKLAMQKGQYVAAEKWLRGALKSDLGSTAHFSLYQCLRSQPGREETAQAEIAHFKEKQERLHRQARKLEEWEKNPHNPDLLVELGEIFLLNQEVAKARQYLLRALQIRPDHEKARRLLPATLKHSG